MKSPLVAPRPRGAGLQPAGTYEEGTMPHIDLGVADTEFPGITGPLRYRPETAKPRGELAGAPVSPKLRALLHIAGAVQRGGKQVTASLVEAARTAGASDVEIHDTVLIAAAFCMYNRYVDGLGTLAGRDTSQYAVMAQLIVAAGYGADRPA